jgi:outer membrane protein assembly factor BamB
MDRHPTLARRSAFAAVLALTLAACAGPTPESAGNAVPTYRGNAARTGEMAGPGPSGTPTIAWQFDAEGPFANSPVVADGIVYAASGEGTVHALDLATGTERWTVSIDALVSASPLLAGGLVIVGDEDGIVHALKAGGGEAAWTAETDGGAITGSPATIGDDLIVATNGTHAYRLVAATGEVKWSIDVGGGSRRSVTADDETAYLGIDGEMVAIDLDDGAELWRTTVAETGDVGTPTIAGDLVYAATGISGEPEDYGIAAVDRTTGAVRWRYASPIQEVIYTPAVVDGRAFVLGHDRQVVAMDAATGASIWTRTFDTELEALPSVVGDTVFVIANDGLAAALDVATGEMRWSVPIEGEAFAPTIADGFLLVGTNVGHLYAIGGSR